MGRSAYHGGVAMLTYRGRPAGAGSFGKIPARGPGGRSTRRPSRFLWAIDPTLGGTREHAPARGSAAGPTGPGRPPPRVRGR